MTSDPQRSHFDLHVTGIGYLNRIREVKPRKGSTFHACSINALRGDGEAPEYTRFDRIILNMLYDRRIRNGASIGSVQEILPAVLADVKRRVP